METHYLIDYENCHKDGLAGCDKLKGTDHIYLFYTDNAKDTTFDIFINHGKAELIIKKVPLGDQSLDKHLIAYLGYLIGKNTGKQAEYVIISKDTGYDKVSSFLQLEEKNSKITRYNKIAKKTSETQKTEKKKTTTANQTPQKTTKFNSDKKTKLNQQVQQALSSSDVEYGPGVINAVAKVVTSHYEEKRFMNEVHNELRKMYPDDYLDVYADIKPILSKYATEQDKKSAGANKTLIHNEIQQILSRANAGKEAIALVPGLVVKYIDEKNAKQVIYREILQKFGQMKGLDVYKRIKKHI